MYPLVDKTTATTTDLVPRKRRWRRARAVDGALGRSVVDTCFRVFRDAERAVELYAEAWAEIYLRVRLSTARLPRSFGPWAAGVVGEVVEHAADEGRIPVHARESLPRDFSAAADRMLLAMPEPAALNRVQPSVRGDAR